MAKSNLFFSRFPALGRWATALGARLRGPVAPVSAPRAWVDTCPSNEEIWAAATGQANLATRLLVGLHRLDCAQCNEIWALAQRLNALEESEPLLSDTDPLPTLDWSVPDSIAGVPDINLVDISVVQDPAANEDSDGLPHTSPAACIAGSWTAPDVSTKSSLHQHPAHFEPLRRCASSGLLVLVLLGIYDLKPAPQLANLRATSHSSATRVQVLPLPGKGRFGMHAKVVEQVDAFTPTQLKKIQALQALAPKAEAPASEAGPACMPECRRASLDS